MTGLTRVEGEAYGLQVKEERKKRGYLGCSACLNRGEQVFELWTCTESLSPASNGWCKGFDIDRSVVDGEEE